MEASLNSRDRTLISVSVTEVAEHTDDEVLEAALDAANETRARLFGWTVERSHVIDGAIVYLHTD